MGTGGKLLLWDVERVIVDKFGTCLSTAFGPYALVGSLQLLVGWAGRWDSAAGRLGELRALAGPAKEHPTGLAELHPGFSPLSTGEMTDWC